MPRLSTDLSQGTYTQFVERCKEEHRKHSDAVRMLIEKWLNEEEARD